MGGCPGLKCDRVVVRSGSEVSTMTPGSGVSWVPGPDEVVWVQGLGCVVWTHGPTWNTYFRGSGERLGLRSGRGCLDPRSERGN